MEKPLFRAPDPIADVDEWGVRVQLAACYRLLAYFNLDDVVYTHVSARVPGTHDQFLINPYGMHFSEITASSLVKIDMHGKMVEPSDWAVNEAGFVIHSAIHGVREDAMCVAHTHSPAGVAVSSLAEGLLPLNQVSLEFYGHLAYHDYEGIVLDMSEQDRIIASLSDKRAMMLRNHGLLTTGRTVPEAFYLMYNLDLACRLQLLTTSSNSTVVPVPEDVAIKTAQQFRRYDTPRGTLEWPALLRLLDRQDDSYKK